MCVKDNKNMAIIIRLNYTTEKKQYLSGDFTNEVTYHQYIERSFPQALSGNDHFFNLCRVL